MQKILSVWWICFEDDLTQSLQRIKDDVAHLGITPENVANKRTLMNYVSFFIIIIVIITPSGAYGNATLLFPFFLFLKSSFQVSFLPDGGGNDELPR